MRLQHLTPTGRALCRVFNISETLYINAPLAILTPRERFVPLSSTPSPAITPTRTYATKFRASGDPMAAKPTGNDNRRPIDEQIGTLKIQLITDAGVQPPVHLREALRNLDRENYHLVKVAEGQRNTYDPTGGAIPLCKILTKQEYREQEKAKEDAARKQKQQAKKGGSGGAGLKQLELNWAIGENDLGHRLKRLTEFLSKGMRVEVMLAEKRRGAKKATLAEAEEVVRRIREAAGEVKGAKEWKTMEGKVGGNVVLHFEGTKEKEKS